MSTDIKKDKSSIKSRYRPEIDGLRAFAVVAVIINHFNKEILPNGYLGVDIFFVISGFVITSSLYLRPSKNFKDFISGFYERRIKRLVPALSIFVLIMSILICFFNPNSLLSLETGLFSLFGLSNIYLLKHSTDYFAQSTQLNVFTHTWSLGVEEQFYILFPLLIWFSGFGRQTKNGVRNLFLILSSLTIASLIGFLFLYPINQSAAYFLMPTRFWEMASGSLLFIGLRKSKYIEQFLEKVPPILSLTLIIGVMYLPISLATISTIAVVILSLFLIDSLKKGTALYTFFTNPKVVYIGQISYSLYLWHWGVLAISRWTIGIYWWTVPFQVVIIFGLAVASYKYIETPLRKDNWFAKRWKTFVVSGGVLLAISTSIQLARKFPLLRTNLFLGSSQFWQSTWWRDSDGKYIEYCHVQEEFNISKIEECLGQPRSDNAKGNAFIIGDSHARNYVGAVREALPNREVRYLTMGWGCAFLPENLINKKVDQKVSCINYVKNVSEYIQKNKMPGDLVFIGQSLLDQNKYGIRESDAYFSHIKKFATSIGDNSIPIIIFDGTFPPGDPYLCQKEVWRPFPDKKNCQKTLEQTISAYSKFDEFGRKITKDSQNIYYIPLRTGLCVGEICGQYTSQGTQIWHDFGHISEQASQELAKLLKDKLTKAGIKIAQ